MCNVIINKTAAQRVESEIKEKANEITTAKNEHSRDICSGWKKNTGF